jgi:hypothetical protein
VSDRRGARFLIEVVFFGALAAGLAFTRLTPIEIVGVMLVGWAIVAMVEWTWSHSEPHFSSGFPPRYVVPKADLPPPRPLEQVPAGYPDATRDEAPTWIAPPALRAEVLGDWPVAAAGVVARPEPEDEPDVADLDPADLPDPDSWTVVELPPAVLEAPEPVPEPVPLETVPLETVAPAPVVPEPIDAVEPRPRPVPTSATEVRLARYSFDPLAEPARRRFGRARPGSGPGLDVPAHPYGIRVLPGRRG